jgi:hypothetical protein
VGYIALINLTNKFGTTFETKITKTKSLMWELIVDESDALPTPWGTQMWIPNRKQWKSKESGHAPWLVALWKGRGACGSSGMGALGWD